MESFVIQSNNQGLAEIEGFLGCFCDENHIANYFATISVPVLQAVETPSSMAMRTILQSWFG